MGGAAPPKARAERGSEGEARGTVMAKVKGSWEALHPLETFNLYVLSGHAKAEHSGRCSKNWP